jgi:hypothetical protein
MKYIISERQYRLLTEDEEQKVLKVPSVNVFGGWEGLQAFLKKKGNPLFSIKGNLSLTTYKLKNIDNLVSVSGNFVLYEPVKSIGNLLSVGGDLDLSYTNIKSLNNLKYVGGNLILTGTPLSKTTTEEEIRQQVEVGGNIYLKWNT